MDSSEMRGLTPRLVESIFQTIMNAPSNLEFTVKVSFLEIYMERIKDLLNRMSTFMFDSLIYLLFKLSMITYRSMRKNTKEFT